MKEKEIEKENESEKKEIESKQKKSEYEERKEKECENEKKNEKEIKNKKKEKTKEKDDSERGQVRNISTNQLVSKSLSDEFQLQYCPDERWFKLTSKVCFLELFLSKCDVSIDFKSPQFRSIDGDNIADELVSIKAPHLGMNNCHSSIIDDVSILNDDKESIFNENHGVDEHVGEVISIRPLQNLVVYDSGCPCKQFNYFG
ncbi:hypothetical protein J1N35_041118, partial [Gossypium stocksii]